MIIDYFLPDVYTDTVYDIDPLSLKGSGVRLVLLDIDNTLVTYDDPKPTESVLAWFRGLEECGIKIAFISNNNEERVALFNSELGFFAAWDSKKPSKKNYLKAIEHYGLTVSDSAVIGDQVFTDVWSAKLTGCRSYLVKPIKDKKTALFRFKRALEVPVLKRYAAKHAKS